MKLTTDATATGKRQRAASRRSTRRSAAAGATTVVKPASAEEQDNLKTPARSVPAAKGAAASASASQEKAPDTNETTAAVNTVTPPDVATTAAKEQVAEASLLQLKQQQPLSSSEATGAKHVRFGKETDTSIMAATSSDSIADEKKEASPVMASESNESSSTKSQRGLVSRRGRFLPPGMRQSSAPTTSTVATTTTASTTSVFRSPPRKRSDAAEGEVPSLVSTNSGQLVTNNAAPDKDKESPSSSLLDASSSCDPAKLVNASPLASHGTEEGNKTANKASPTAAGSAVSDSNSKQGQIEASNKTKPTTASTKGGERKNPQIPKLEEDDGKTSKAPDGILPPSSAHYPLPTTPSRRVVTGPTPSEEKKIEALRHEDDADKKPSPKRDRDRDRYVTTPTDFALDYGKGQQVSASFDTSNVLAWLQSPTANGLFSPGGYGSIMNTPSRGAAAAPRTPRTPTVSTSFFFSDVAGLPRSSNESTPHGDSARRAKNGISNIICISPLSAAKARNGTSIGATPLSTAAKDLFATSPKEKTGRNMPTDDSTPSRAQRPPRVPQRTSSKDPSLDAALAERDLMEDEDLSVLLQLASNTPRSAERGAAAAGSHVFRSPVGKRKAGETAVAANSNENLPALQLPMIGGAQGDGKMAAARLARKPDSHPDAEDFAPPQLGMRSGTGSSSGSKEIYVSGTKDGSKTAGSMSDGKEKGTPPKKPKPPTTSSNPYVMPPPYPSHPGHEFYPPIPPGMPPGASGSMRVSIGGPPPRKGVAGTPPRHPSGPPSVGSSPHAPPPPYGDPYSVHYAPHPGLYPYSQHMGMGGYPPYQGHYPPPPHQHMSMYGAQQQPTPGSEPKKSKSKSKSGGKRGSPSLDKAGGPSKKTKKNPNGPKKVKNRSPQITDPVEREKAAAAIKELNSASGGKNDKAAALATAIMRGVTMRPSGKWQAQLYFAGKSRYIGVFDTREKAALAYEIAREQLKNGESQHQGTMCPETTENLVNRARKAAFEGVNEKIKK